ncbi:pol polyprotein, partial [Pseudoloma neurophilia]
LETHASNVGLGASLRQNGNPIFHISRVLKGAEINYAITEKELLATLWAMEKLMFYLIGKRFHLVTDHKAIEMINEKKNFGNARIERWMHRFAEFDFVPIYREETSNIGTDALSRNASFSEREVKERNKEVNTKFEKEILEFDKSNGHREKIKKDLRDVQIIASDSQINGTLSNCLECAMKDKCQIKSAEFQCSENTGDRVEST